MTFPLTIVGPATTPRYDEHSHAVSRTIPRLLAVDQPLSSGEISLRRIGFLRKQFEHSQGDTRSDIQAWDVGQSVYARAA